MTERMPRTLRQTFALLIAGNLLVSQAIAQGPAQQVETPSGPLGIRSYNPARLPEVQLKNTDRLHSLMRGGKLYLTVQDAIAVAIENNLDLEVDRYGPVAAEWNLRRQRAGGALAGVTSGNGLTNQATSGQGVEGSQVAAGLSQNNNGNGGGSSGTVSQLGPITPNLDPVFQNTTFFAHSTSPQANTTQSQVTALVDTKHVIDSFVQQGLITGGFVQITAHQAYLKQNS